MAAGQGPRSEAVGHGGEPAGQIERGTGAPEDGEDAMRSVRREEAWLLRSGRLSPLSNSLLSSLHPQFAWLTLLALRVLLTIASPRKLSLF